jgi:DNA primase large subunit
MVSLGHDEIAKYPFLAEAGKYLQDKGFTLEQFATDPDLQIIVDKAYERIESAANGKIYNPKFDNSDTFSFLIAIILLKLSGMNTLINRFSLAEARRAEKFLEKDLVDNSNKTSEELAIKIIRDIFSVSVKKDKNNFVIPISDYLRHAVNFHELEWKLVNRHVESGMVFLSPHETVRLIRRELGGYTIFMTPQDSQLGRDEPLKDTARVISRYGHLMIVRTFGQKKLEELAKYSTIPIINALSDEYHPCQVMSDLLTIYERTPDFSKLKIRTYMTFTLFKRSLNNKIYISLLYGKPECLI